MTELKNNYFGEPLFRQTYTYVSGDADEFFTKIANKLKEEWEWADISPSIPLIMNNALYYTVTITAGNLV